MARGRLELKRIENAASRQATFCRRRMQLLKRARELSSVCDAEVALIGFSSSGTLFEYAGPRSMQQIIQAYFDTRAGKPPSEHSAYCPFQDIDIVRLKLEIQRLEEQERRLEELEFLSVMDLEKLESELVSDLNSVRCTKDFVMAEQRKEFVRKEQELLRENESLRKELKRARSGVEEVAVSTCSASLDFQNENRQQYTCDNAFEETPNQFSDDVMEE